jgi:hypothetical protein
MGTLPAKRPHSSLAMECGKERRGGAGGLGYKVGGRKLIFADFGRSRPRQPPAYITADGHILDSAGVTFVDSEYKPTT